MNRSANCQFLYRLIASLVASGLLFRRRPIHYLLSWSRGELRVDASAGNGFRTGLIVDLGRIRIAGNPEILHSAPMELVKIGKKGQITIPRRVLSAAGLASDAQLIVEVEPDNSVRLRPAVVFPAEHYSEQRIAEFERENQLPDELLEKVNRVLK